jgi:hypothetical protein
MKQNLTPSFSRVRNQALAIIALAGSCFAADWYIDALHGVDSNSGMSPAQAWRTITYAMAAVPIPAAGGTQVLHLAPGSYAASSGESFPIVLRDAFQIVGDHGAGVTALDGGSAVSILKAGHASRGGNAIGPLTLVQGLTLRNAGHGVFLEETDLTMYLTLRDVRIEGMRSAGFRAVTQTFHGQGRISATLAGVEITDCDSGIAFESRTPVIGGLTDSLTLSDCNIWGNRAIGIYDLDSGSGTELHAARVRVFGNGSDGVLIDAPFGIHSHAMIAELSDCLIARNQACGVRVRATGVNGAFTNIALNVLRCTIADNASSGLDLYFEPSPWHEFTTALSGTILFGNQVDIRGNPAYPSIHSPAFNDVGDGDYAGQNGNIAVDPLFRDRANGDYRLEWGSPCIDVGDPATPMQALDLQRVKRPVDGDLDVHEVADIGAFEFTPLWVVDGAHIGANLTFEQSGPSGGIATLFMARGSPMASPQSTPFGDFDLNPNAFRNLGAAPIAPRPSAQRWIPIPDDPLYIGQTFSFQALSTSSVVSPPMAYTNPVTVTVLP